MWKDFLVNMIKIRNCCIPQAPFSNCNQLSRRNEEIQLQVGQKENVFDVQVTLQWKGTSLLQLCLTLWTDATLDWCKNWSAFIQSWEKSVQGTKKGRELSRPPGEKQTAMFYNARASTAQKGRKHEEAHKDELSLHLSPSRDLNPAQLFIIYK